MIFLADCSAEERSNAGIVTDWQWARCKNSNKDNRKRLDSLCKSKS